MACCLDSAKPLSEPMLEYCWLEPSKQTSVKSLAKFIHFHLRILVWKRRLRNGGHFVSATNVADIEIWQYHAYYNTVFFLLESPNIMVAPHE